MAIKFQELRQYLGRNVRLSICFEDGHYDNYLILSDIPDGRYDDLYVYGVGKIDVEFSKDVFTKPDTEFSLKDIDLCPALEIVLHDRPRDDVGERKDQDALRFGDLRNYLQVFGHMAVVMRNSWISEEFDQRDDIPESYNEYFVYGVTLEEDPHTDERFQNMDFDNAYKKQMVVVLSEERRKDLREEKGLMYGNGPFFLLVTADEWCHDADEWLGIYVSKQDAREAYDRAVAWWDEEQKHMRFSTPQRVAMFEYIAPEDKFREVERKELD